MPSPPPTPAPPAVAPPEFRWADVAAPERDWLRRRTEDLHALVYRSACDLVRIGILLAEVRERLPGRQFAPWLATETPYSRATAYRLIASGEAFGAYLSQIETVEPCALYLLAQPTVPASAREYAAELAGDGKPVTFAVAREILDAHRPTADPSRVEVQAHEANVKEMRQREKALARPEHPPPDPARAAGHWAAFERLVATCSVVHISTLDDEDDAPLYSVSCHWPDLAPGEVDTRPRNVVRRALADAIAAAAGCEEEKRCPACKKVKKLGEYGFNLDEPDGRAAQCLACERDRRKRNRKKPKKKGRA